MSLESLLNQDQNQEGENGMAMCYVRMAKCMHIICQNHADPRFGDADPHFGGGFKHFLFSTLPGEMMQFDEHIFQMG